MDLPDILLEQVFSYLNWNDRSRAARVCRHWLSVFHSPCLWRKIVFRSPNRIFTRFQYDMEGYRISCCLRTIGPYIREYRFLKNDDIFLLNRTLSLVAKFLEANPHTSFSEGDQLMLDLDEKLSEHSGEEPIGDDQVSASEESWDEMESPSYVRKERLSDYLTLVQGDPDAEATLNLILKLQERELLGASSDSGEEKSEDSVSMLEDVRVSMSASLPRSNGPQGKTHGRKYQRSQSCRYPRYPNPHRPAPAVYTFLLDFHCEVDELRGIAYGTGGALLSTIRRVVRQLRCVNRLQLTDLFLAASDARRLVLDLHETASRTLTNLDLTHLHKLSLDGPILEPFRNPVIVYQRMPDSSTEVDWYLLDHRWLSARPRHVHQNPIADLASLFPNLTRLTLAPSQLSGSMLLRLLYQTCLIELCLVETEFTAFTVQRGSYEDASGYRPFHNIDEDDDEGGIFHPEGLEDDELIDWSGDVPHFRDRLNSMNVALNSTDEYQPISRGMWRAALTLRPGLSVILKFSFGFSLFEHHTMTTLVTDVKIAQLLALWPDSLAPVTAFMFRAFNMELAVHFLNLKNVFNITTYSSTINTFILFLDSCPTAAGANSAGDSVSIQCDELADIILDAFKVCQHLSLIAFGGSRTYLSILTALVICHRYSRRKNSSNPSVPFRLLIEGRCCRFDACSTDKVSATVRAWYNTIMECPSAERVVVAQNSISSALGQPRWRFLTPGEFQSSLSDYLL